MLVNILPVENIEDILSHVPSNKLKTMTRTSLLFRDIVVKSRKEDILVNLTENLLLSTFFHRWNNIPAVCIRNSWSHSTRQIHPNHRIIFMS